MGLNHWESDCETEVGKRGLAATSTQMLAESVFACSSQEAMPASILFICGTMLGVCSDQGTWWGMDLPALDPQMRNFTIPKTQGAHAKQAAESQPHMLWKVSSDQMG